MQKRILRSELDRSINIVDSSHDGGYFESRFVSRQADTAIIYLSSMSGCDRACRFCHLTQTGQTQMREASLEGIYNQARGVIFEMNPTELHDIKTVHYNFMARGDVLSNSQFVSDFGRLFQALTFLTKAYFPNATAKFKLSTIFPTDINFDHEYEFNAYDVRAWIVNRILNLSAEKGWDVEFYYSLYSLRKEFRKRWIPKAIDPEWIGQAFTGRDEGFRLHHALIAGENDTEEDIALIHDWLERHDLKVKLNLVKFNPYQNCRDTESDIESTKTYMNLMSLSHRIIDIQQIDRVGFDVAASCGMFFEGD